VIVVNGEPRALAEPATVAAVVDDLGLRGGRRGVAVAVDGEVVPRGAWDTTTLADGAKVEVVQAVQGG
jgi:sulfur carrier protein